MITLSDEQHETIQLLLGRDLCCHGIRGRLLHRILPWFRYGARVEYMKAHVGPHYLMVMPAQTYRDILGELEAGGWTYDDLLRDQPPSPSLREGKLVKEYFLEKSVVLHLSLKDGGGWAYYSDIPQYQYWWQELLINIAGNEFKVEWPPMPMPEDVSRWVHARLDEDNLTIDWLARDCIKHITDRMGAEDRRWDTLGGYG
ncbi:hypothetical protein CENSYa_0220 [Cenarchaeum symbiosum A]|uniref:Uncharacterized protein n=1 Tax=Cenarchaeum symbiosum (strain A) TaxID=414004 RepID=A0RU46_CENSY|nr:hypothetical protein CENSYa_0220 [Cenarchaeum symbiosum A]